MNRPACQTSACIRAAACAWCSAPGTGAGLLISIDENARLTLDLDTTRQVKVRLLEPGLPALTLSGLVPGIGRGSFRWGAGPPAIGSG